MNSLVVLVGLFVLFGCGLAVIAFLAYRRTLRHAKGIERGLKMVPLLIHLPPPSDDTESGSRPIQEVMREKVNQAQVIYDLIAGTAQGGFKSTFYGQRHIAFEIVASNGLVHYFAAVPIALVEVVEQAIVTAYPGARLEEVEDHNIFNPQGRLTSTVGGELVLKHEAAYPIGVIENMERDPMEALINSLYKLQLGDGAAVQIMLRPARANWVKQSIKLVAKKRHTGGGGIGFGVGDLAKAAIKAPETPGKDAPKFEPSKLEEQMLQAIEDKTKHPGYEVLVRVLASSPNYSRSQIVLRNLVNAFSLFEAPGSNGFQFIEARDIQGLVTAFIFRFFPPELVSTVLNSVEMAALFHLPDAQFTSTTQVERQQSKQVDGPVNMPPSGMLLGYNFYRGVKKEIRLSPEDRRRHAYIVGQTGTGKSTMLENLAVQDMLAGNGFAFIDPHGDVAERLLSMVPKERAEDVVYFSPGDMEHPLGLNIFEYSTPEQKDFLIQESLNMLYKLYDPGKTGIIGPRFEHWYRNAALTLMADPNGASFIELPKVFTDSTYLKNKFKYLQDPTVIDFWTKEMGQTSDYHKSEMLGWFVSKFGAFQTNDMMRNIIGQTHSSFNLRDIMDNKKMLIVNLSKGRVGELNSQLLGMIFVIKIQAAAMSRADIPEDQRSDFCLYVDEFQNFSTDSFAAILSEARKFRLNLIVANQYISQLTDDIRNAVFGNVGSILSYRTGPEDAEFLAKQFEPVFDERDLVNLPNHNAVMKLLIGGLPSQPFSMTALPPLGVAHPEMGVAIQQLSAAKYGSARAVVEADIFARLQNQPVAPPPAPPLPTSSPAATSSAPASAPVAAAPAATPPPPAPPTNHAALLPTAAAAPPAPASAPAPSDAPPSPPPVPATSSPPDNGLALNQLRQTATPPPQASPPVSKPATGGIADIVKASPPPPRLQPAPEPTPAPPASASSHPPALPAPPPVLEIEAQEADGYTGSLPIPPSQPVNPPPPSPQPPMPPQSQPQPVPAAPPSRPKPTSPAPPVPKPPVTPPPPVSRSAAPPARPVPAPAPAPTPSVSAPAPTQRPAASRPPQPAQPQRVQPTVAVPRPMQPLVAPPPKPQSTPAPAPQSLVTPPPPSPAPKPPAAQSPVSPAPSKKLQPLPQLQPAPLPPQPSAAPPASSPRSAPKPPVAPPPKPQPAPVPRPTSTPTPPPAPKPPVTPPPPKPAPPVPKPQPVPSPASAPSAADEPVLPSDPMTAAHIELHHHGRASEDPFSQTAQQAMAGQGEPMPSAAPQPPPSPPPTPQKPLSAATVNDAYAQAAAPRAVTPVPPPPAADLETTLPDVPAPHPGEVIAPKTAAAPVPPPPSHMPQSVPKPQPPKPKASKPAPSPAKPPPAPTKPQPKKPHVKPPQASHRPMPEPPKPKPAPSPQPPVAAPPVPDLKPGEIYVNENGEIVQG